MSFEIRPELPGDEDALELVNCAAFGRMSEACIVRLMREYCAAYDRRYSITAWEDGEMVGHVLMTPARIRLLGATIKALAVGPVAVMPERQRKGIGGRMLRYGHDLGRKEGFALAFLYGHPSYYPRYGYDPCFGTCKTIVNRDKLPEPGVLLIRRPVYPSDVPWIVERAATEWDDVDFGWLWGESLNDWSVPFMNTLMWWTPDGRRAAYTVARHASKHCELMLAHDPALSCEVIATLRPSSLGNHPAGWLARNALDADWAEPSAAPCEAAMAIELEPGILGPLRKSLASGHRPPGVALYPLPFLAC